MKQIFAGIKVLDFTKVFSGPFATRMLADYGAEVLKIEHTSAPDDARFFPPLKQGWSGYFELLNRNKKGLALDIKTEQGKKTVYRLCQEADVVVENWSPSTKKRLGVDYQTLCDYNQQIIYASLSGTNQQTDRKYYDVIAQAESGLLSLSGTPDLPMKIGPSVVDAFSGMTLAFAIAGALFSRQKTGKGQYLEVSMLGCAMNLLESNLVEYCISGKDSTRTENKDSAIAPFGVYKAKDGYIVIAAGNNKLWQTLAQFLGQYISFDQNLFSTNSQRLTHTSELTRIIEEVLSHQPVSEVLTLLSERSIPCAPVRSMKDVAACKDLVTSGLLRSVNDADIGSYLVPGHAIRFSGCDVAPLQPAPTIGQDNSLYGVHD